MKPVMTKKGETGKSTNYRNNTILNNQWAKEEMKREIRKYLETN